jgi:hypothetical protein
MTDEVTLRKFNHNPSPEYTRAVEALDALLQVSSLAEVERACAAALHEPRRQAYAEKHGEEVTDPATLAALPDSPLRQVSWYDHQSEWVVDGKLASVVVQPYHDLSFQTLQHLVKECQEKGLHVSVSAVRSWYYPGWTLLLEFTEGAESEARAAPDASDAAPARNQQGVFEAYSYKKGYHQGFTDALDLIRSLMDDSLPFFEAAWHCRQYWRGPLLLWLRNEHADVLQPPPLKHPEGDFER